MCPIYLFVTKIFFTDFLLRHCFDSFYFRLWLLIENPMQRLGATGAGEVSLIRSSRTSIGICLPDKSTGTGTCTIYFTVCLTLATIGASRGLTNRSSLLSLHCLISCSA